MTHGAIDRSVYAELQANAGAEFVAELTATFLEEAPGMLAELRSAQAAGRADVFRRAAHSLKSNSLTFGASALGDLARVLEQGGLNPDAGALDRLEAEYRRVAAELGELIRG